MELTLMLDDKKTISSVAAPFICICVLNIELLLLHKETQAVQFETEVKHSLHL